MNFFQRLFTKGDEIKTETRSTGFSSWGDVLNGGSKLSVSKSTIETIPSVFAAIRILSQTIAVLPIQYFREDDKNKIVDKSSDLYYLLHNEPNKFQTPFQFKEWLTRSLIVNGNSIFVINWNYRTMTPKELIPVDWSRVKVSRKDGVLYYQIDESKDLILEQSQILHFKQNSNDGVIGRGVLDVALESFSHAKNLENFGSKFFENGTQLTGVLQSDKVLTDKAIEHLRTTWASKYSGVTNSSGVAILEDGLKFSPINISPEQAQFLQSRKFSKNEIATWFGLPPDKIGDLERATFSNIEQQDLNFAKHSITPYVVNIEEELNKKLIKEKDKRSTFFKLSMNALLRGDISSRFAAYKEGILNGFISPNEARGYEDLNPYEGGSEFWKPLNYIEQKQNNQ